MSSHGGHKEGFSSDDFSLLVQRLDSVEKKVAAPLTANPGPLGLYTFAVTTALFQGSTTGLTEQNTNQLACGYGLFFGGLAQFVAGILEYRRRNTFGMVAFCCFGTFQMSYSFFLTLVAAGVYGPVPEKGERLMLSLFGVLAFLLWLCTFHMTLVTSALFLTLSMLFFFLAGGVGTSQARSTLTKFAGGWGMMVAGIAFYDGTAVMMREVYGRECLPVFPLMRVQQLRVPGAAEAAAAGSGDGATSSSRWLRSRPSRPEPPV